MHGQPQQQVNCPRPRPLALMMETAFKHRGFVTTAQASKLGVDPKELQRLVGRGLLRRESRGLYRVTGCEVGFLDQVMAVTIRMKGVVSHQSAARIWGHCGPGFVEDVVHLTVSHGSHPEKSAGLVIHATRLNLRNFATMRSGVPVTVPLQTVLDISGQDIADCDLGAFLAHCISSRLVTVRSLERYLSSQGRGVRGIVRLRRLLDDLCALDSLVEAELLGILAAAGIERPVTQFVIRDSGRFLGRVDLAWPLRHVALELDGFRFHSDPRSFVSDRERGNRIVAAGWALLRTTPASVRESPHLVIADVRMALARSRAA